MTKFHEKISEASKRNNSLLCIGLDPDPSLMPIKNVFDFNKSIIDATSDLICCYKPNLAFYEALGMPGLESLQKTIEYIPSHIPVIGDAKRGDIGSTAKAYAQALFERWSFDAATINPYLGKDSLDPFLEYQDRGILILCHTSNPSAQDFQELKTTDESGQYLLYEKIAIKANEWNANDNIGLVVGATYPSQMKTVREICPDMLILAPGVGTQGGELDDTIKFGMSPNGGGIIINVSRAVLYASADSGSFSQSARAAASSLKDKINLACSKAMGY